MKPLFWSSDAIRIIEDEHRSLAAVLNGLGAVATEVREGRLAPAPVLLRAMVDYIRQFPERLHHPKEDEHLFRLLRLRAPELAPVLDALGEEHVRGAQLLDRMDSALSGLEAGQLPFDALDQAFRAYAELEWSHMRTEEREVLPAAGRAFTQDDWEEVGAAFRANRDPLSGMDPGRELRELFRRITALAPAPIGVGPAGRKGT
jgi:branched-chain amino acid transport system ATP-binding protein